MPYVILSVRFSRTYQVSLLPECVDDYAAEDNPVRVVRIGKAWHSSIQRYHFGDAGNLSATDERACNMGSGQASLV